jgi:dihydropteroate synthase
MSSPLPGTSPPGPLLPAGNPRIVGIVNITTDSFSDGGRYLDPAAAVAHARRLRAEGADIVPARDAQVRHFRRRGLPERHPRVR